MLDGDRNFPALLFYNQGLANPDYAEMLIPESCELP